MKDHTCSYKPRDKGTNEEKEKRETMQRRLETQIHDLFTGQLCLSREEHTQNFETTPVNPTRKKLGTTHLTDQHIDPHMEAKSIDKKDHLIMSKVIEGMLILEARMHAYSLDDPKVATKNRGVN